ncbi:MAG: Ig-like domain-containing protein [Candidatus Kerfeldbacteria bacterium]|nr:Ig-like domain-containing protein [Candidatus Kerfeldbacteria bacterium]
MIKTKQKTVLHILAPTAVIALGFSLLGVSAFVFWNSVRRPTTTINRNVTSAPTLTTDVDTTPPTVFFVSPTNGQTVSGLADITANASDNSGILKVDFFLDETKLLGTVTPIARGIWLSPDEIMALPITSQLGCETGTPCAAAWTAMRSEAERLVPGNADISDQDSYHDVQTMAAALVCVRTGEFCAPARQAVLAAIGTEERTLTTPTEPPGNQWLAVGRNLGAYVIAADLLDLRASASPEGRQVQDWIQSFIGRVASLGASFGAFQSGSNASAQEGFVYAAVAAFLHDADELAYVWNRFQFFTGASNEGTDDIDLNKGLEYGWAHNDDPNLALPINPIGSTKVVPSGYPGAGTTHRVDGAVINDQRRGAQYQWPPVYTHYPWVGLEGSIPAALILERAGYRSFASADQALFRAVDYQWWLGQELGQSPACTFDCWWDYNRALDIKHLANWRYGTDHPHLTPVAGGRTVGFTDWTHPTLLDIVAIVPYSMTWDLTQLVSLGNHVLSAKSWDTSGNLATAEITVSVSDDGGGGGIRKIPE